MITGTLELDRPLRGPLAPAGRLTEVQPTRVLVVDAHPLARWALQRLASGEADLATAAEAADAEHALTLASACGPDVITLDTALPDGQVWTLARTLREADEHVGIVIITDDPGDDTLFRALDCGASALVHKSAPIREILSAVRHAAGSPGSFTAAGLSAALRRRRDTPERAVLSPANSRSSCCCTTGCRSRRSPPSCSSACPPPRPTSPASTTNSTPETAPKRS